MNLSSKQHDWPVWLIECLWTTGHCTKWTCYVSIMHHLPFIQSDPEQTHERCEGTVFRHKICQYCGIQLTLSGKYVWKVLLSTFRLRHDMTSYFWYGTVYCVIHDWTDIIISIYYHMGLNDAASHPLPSISLNIVQPNRTVTTTTHNDAQECIESRCRAHRFIIWDGVESSLRLSGQTLNICILHVQHCIVPHSYCVVAVNNKAKCGSPVNNTMFCVSVHSSSDWLNVAT